MLGRGARSHLPQVVAPGRQANTELEPHPPPVLRVSQTDHECETLKQLTVAKRKAQLRDQYKRLQAKAKSQLRKDESKVLNDERIRRLRHQDGLLTDLSRDARSKMERFVAAGGEPYADLLPALAGQAIAQIAGREKVAADVELRVRGCDVDLLGDGGAKDAQGRSKLRSKLRSAVKAAMVEALRREAETSARARAEAEADTPEAGAAAAAKAGEAAVADAELPEAVWVKADTRLEADGGRVGGGVIVSASAGRIVVDNSLHARLALVTHELQHVLRAALFPASEAAEE